MNDILPRLRAHRLYYPSATFTLRPDDRDFLLDAWENASRVAAPPQIQNDLQALVVGAVIGALMRAEEDAGLLVDIAVRSDDDGNYLPVIGVTGRESGERLTIRVEAVE